MSIIVAANNRITVVGMQSNHFAFMGRNASMGLFYEGYGISMIFVLIMISLLLWLLASNYQNAIVAVLAVFLMALAITEFIYFFPFAAAFTLLAGLLAGITLFKRT
jgi:hypothetical protein